MKVSWLERLRRDLSEAVSLPELLDVAVRGFQQRVKAQRVEVVLAQGEASVRRFTGSMNTSPSGGEGIEPPQRAPSSGTHTRIGTDLNPPISFSSKALLFENEELKGSILFQLQNESSESRVSRWMRAASTATLMVVPIFIRGRVAGYICAQWGRPYQMHQSVMEAQALGTILSLESYRFLRAVSHQPSIRRDFERLIDLGQLVVLRADAHFVVTELIGNSEKLLGVSREELIHNIGVWQRLFNEEDLKSLRKKLRLLPLAEELKEEIRLVNQVTGEPRWLLVRGLALRGEDGSLVGWELYGVDITDKHLADEGLRRERERLAALHQLSQAVASLAAPELVCSRGMGTLSRSTGADAALAAVRNSETGRIELIAVFGFPEATIGDLEEALQKQSLVRRVMDTNAGVIVEIIPSDGRVAAVALMDQLNLLSAAVAPLRDKAGRSNGAIALFSKSESRWQQAELRLLEAAGVLMSSALQRSQEFAEQRSQVDELQALYELNHELARLVTLSEVAAHALQASATVLPSVWGWFGAGTAAGDSLVGQAAFGSDGVPHTGAASGARILLDDADGRELATWLQRREVRVLRGGEELRSEHRWLDLIEGTLESAAQTVVVLPLVALNQVVGVMVLGTQLSENAVHAKLSLLQSLSSEVGMVVFARRLERKMSEADKMRVTGHLAAGVAHNFNNILQGMLGHASLLQSQLEKGSILHESAKQMVEAAHRGGQLIKQLSSLAQIQGSIRKPLDLGSLLTNSRELYGSALGSKISLVCETKGTIPPVYGDEGLIQQVVMNLLVNAREAIAELEASGAVHAQVDREGIVRIIVETVTVKAGELKPGSRAGRYVRISISDNGIGMSSDLIERCLEPFFSTKGVDPRSGLSLSGAGLGLSSAYAIIREHDGYFDVRSTVGKGSSFVVLFPAMTVAVDASASTTSVSTPSAGIKNDASPSPLARQVEQVTAASSQVQPSDDGHSSRDYSDRDHGNGAQKLAPKNQAEVSANPKALNGRCAPKRPGVRPSSEKESS